MIFAGVDVTKEPIPVLPTVHYNMGGTPTNYRAEVLVHRGGSDKIVPGLLAAGEASCASVQTGWVPTRCWTSWCSAAPPPPPSLRTAGQEKLRRRSNNLQEKRASLTWTKSYSRTALFPLLIYVCECKSPCREMLLFLGRKTLLKKIVESALAREESRGAHAREDFKTRRDEYDYSKPLKGQTKLPFEKHWRKHTMAETDAETGATRLSSSTRRSTNGNARPYLP